MSYDPATVRAVCEFLRSHTTWEGKPDVIGAAYAEVIEERFPTEAPAPEPSTDLPQRIAAWVRGQADERPSGDAAVWRNVADAIEEEGKDRGWRCECGDLNSDHEAFCYRCGAGQPEPSTDTLRELLRQAREALRLTREYVGEDTLPAIPGWSWFDAMQAIDEELAATPAREDDERCEHDWVDIRNRVIKSGEMCSRCGALRPAPWHLRESSEHCTTCGGPCLLPEDKG